jgi:hypothetical protein
VSAEKLAEDKKGWPIFEGSLVRFERGGRVVRGWVKGYAEGVLSCDDAKGGGARSARPPEVEVVRPTRMQKMRAGHIALLGIAPRKASR